MSNPEETPEKKPKQIDRVKAHIYKHRVVYVAAAGVAVGVLVTVVALKTRQVIINDSLNVSINSPKVNHITAALIERSTPSNPVQRLSDSKVWASEGAAAREIGVSTSRLSNHLHRRSPHINGERFQFVPKMETVAA